MNKNMTKAELVSQASEASHASKVSTEKVLNALLDSIQAALSEGKNVTLVGFGTFSISDRNERTGRNPRTGETIHIPASKIAKFKPGKNLREAVND